jgi:hypothetical protein
MEKGNKRRIKALKAMNGLIDVRISGLRLQQRKEDKQLSNLKRKQSEIEAEIHSIESHVRTALDPGRMLNLDEYRMLLTFLNHKQGLRINNERQQGFSKQRLKKAADEMIQQSLKVRGIEHLLQRRRKELQLETESKLLSLLDDAWLHRKGARK